MIKRSLLGRAKLASFIAGGLALAAVLVISNLAVAPLQIAFSQQGQTTSIVPAPNMVIEASGEASVALEPDQVTIVLGKQSRVVNASEIVEIQNSDSDAVVSAIKSALGEDDSSAVVAGGFYLNPFTARPFPLPNPSQTYTVNINTAIQIAPDDLAEAADKIANAGFSVESIYLASSMYPSPFPYGYGYSEEAESSDATNDPQNGTDSQITLSLAVASESDTLDNIMSKYEELSDRLDVLLQDLGVEASQPPTASFYPSYYEGVLPPYPSSEYTLHSQVIVKTDPGNVEMIVEAAGEQGAYMQSLSMSFSDARLDEARIQLNQEALENARERANEMGAPLGLQVQAVRSISIGGGNEFADMPMYRGVSLSFAFPYSGMPSEEISVTLTAEFEMG